MITKFRAFDKFDKEMLEVHGINFDARGIWTKEMIDDESDGEFIHFSDIELLQSTGLKDKNDVEIFEGDVVKVKAEDPEPKMRADRYETGVIIYAYGSFDIETKLNTVSGLIPESNLTDILLTFEVIGNIYQHPHLLEE